MPPSVKYVRPLVYGVSTVLALGLFIFVFTYFASPTLQTIRLAQAYGFTAAILLYFSLLASPLNHVFPNIPTRVFHAKAKKALGISAFFFALLHACIEFFFLLGGLNGLKFLTPTYLTAITLSFSALLILSILALTSIKFLKTKLGTHWKTLHRLVYLAGTLIVVHAFIIGTHFMYPSSPIFLISSGAIAILFFLQSIRLDHFLSSTFPRYPKSTIPAFILIIAALILAKQGR